LWSTAQRHNKRAHAEEVLKSYIVFLFHFVFFYFFNIYPDVSKIKQLINIHVVNKFSCKISALDRAVCVPKKRKTATQEQQFIITAAQLDSIKAVL
jgi:hypothetical protein